jgi:hypothetical protein
VFAAAMPRSGAGIQRLLEPIGVAQVKDVNDEADLLKLFVEHIAPGRHPSCVIVSAKPSSRGRGINRAAYHPLHLRIR